MHLDVQDLRSFYYRTSLGRAVQRVIRERMAEFWPEARGQTMVVYGFAVPLLRPYMNETRRVIGLMPGPQGVMPWPPGMPNVSVLCRDTHWPLQTESVDKLVVLHGLETSDTPLDLMDESQEQQLGSYHQLIKADVHRFQHPKHAKEETLT